MVSQGNSVRSGFDEESVGVLLPVLLPELLSGSSSSSKVTSSGIPLRARRKKGTRSETSGSPSSLCFG